MRLVRAARRSSGLSRRRSGGRDRIAGRRRYRHRAGDRMGGWIGDRAGDSGRGVPNGPRSATADSFGDCGDRRSASTKWCRGTRHDRVGVQSAATGACGRIGDASALTAFQKKMAVQLGIVWDDPRSLANLAEQPGVRIISTLPTVPRGDPAQCFAPAACLAVMHRGEATLEHQLEVIDLGFEAWRQSRRAGILVGHPRDPVGRDPFLQRAGRAFQRIDVAAGIPPGRDGRNLRTAR